MPQQAAQVDTVFRYRVGNDEIRLAEEQSGMRSIHSQTGWKYSGEELQRSMLTQPMLP